MTEKLIHTHTHTHTHLPEVQGFLGSELVHLSPALIPATLCPEQLDAPPPPLWAKPSLPLLQKPLKSHPDAITCLKPSFSKLPAGLSLLLVPSQGPVVSESPASSPDLCPCSASARGKAASLSPSDRSRL